METEPEATLWDLVIPLWMFRCRPSDFRSCGNSICPGVFWLPGMTALLALHVVSFLGCWFLWQAAGSWAFLSLLPLGILWGWLVAADVKFRWQRPTRQERSGFDNAVVNWFGLVSTLAFYFVIVPVGVVALMWWWLAEG
jgi:hypothetical protein